MEEWGGVAGVDRLHHMQHAAVQCDGQCDAQGGVKREGDKVPGALGGVRRPVGGNNGNDHAADVCREAG